MNEYETWEFSVLKWDAINVNFKWFNFVTIQPLMNGKFQEVFLSWHSLVPVKRASLALKSFTCILNWILLLIFPKSLQQNICGNKFLSFSIKFLSFPFLLLQDELRASTHTKSRFIRWKIIFPSFHIQNVPLWLSQWEA